MKKKWTTTTKNLIISQRSHLRQNPDEKQAQSHWKATYLIKQILGWNIRILLSKIFVT